MINQIKSLKMAILKESYVLICEHNHCASMLLNFFEQWHNLKVNNKESLIQWHTVAEMESALFGLFKDRAIREALNVLHNLGFVLKGEPKIRIKNHPPRMSYFFFNEDLINEHLVILQEANCDFEVYKTVKIQFQNCKNTVSKLQNDGIKTVKIQFQNCKNAVLHGFLPYSNIEYTKNTTKNTTEDIPEKINFSEVPPNVENSVIRENRTTENFIFEKLFLN